MQEGPPKGLSRREFFGRAAAVTAPVFGLSRDVPRNVSWREIELSEAEDNILVFTDLHSGEPEDDTRRMLTSRAASELGYVLSRLPLDEFDANLNLGDSIQDGSSNTRNAWKLSRVMEVFPQAKTHHSGGNHDLRNLNRSAYEDVLVNRGFPRFHGVLKFPKSELQIIYLDMETTDGVNGNLSDSMVDYLIRDPNNEIDTGYDIVIAGHYDMLRARSGQNFRHFANNPESTAYSNGEEVLARMLAAGMPVIATVSGHVHTYHYEAHKISDTTIHSVRFPSFTERATTSDSDHIPGIFNMIQASEDRLVFTSLHRGHQVGGVTISR